MGKYKKILLVLPLILSICTSFYLTYTVDLITLESFLQKTFVFIFFVFSISLLFYIFKKHIGLSNDVKIIACAVLLSVSLDFSAISTAKNIILPAIGSIITLSSFLYVALVIVKKRLEKRKNQSYLTKNFVWNTFIFSIYLLLVNIFLETLEKAYGYSPEDITLKIGFIILLLIYPYTSRVLPMFKRFKIAEAVLLFVIVFLVTFQSTAEIFFMSLDKSSVNATDILSFAIAMIIVAVPILELTLFIDKHTQNRFWEGEKNEKE